MGGLVSVLAWLAGPPATRLGFVCAAGLAGGLAGGVLLTVVLEPGPGSSVLSLIAAAVGAVAVLDFTEHGIGVPKPGSGSSVLHGLWVWALLLEPLMLALLLGVAAGGASRSAWLGGFVAAGVLASIGWWRHGRPRGSR